MSTPLDPMLLDVLICPNCKGRILFDDKESLIRCVGDCRYAYPVIDGIPHMLIDEAVKP